MQSALMLCSVFFHLPRTPLAGVPQVERAIATRMLSKHGCGLVLKLAVLADLVKDAWRMLIMKVPSDLDACQHAVMLMMP